MRSNGLNACKCLSKYLKPGFAFISLVTCRYSVKTRTAKKFLTTSNNAKRNKMENAFASMRLDDQDGRWILTMDTNQRDHYVST